MKKIIIVIAAIVAVSVGCKKKSPDLVSRIVTASYPVITITGQQFVSIPVGGSFTDLGATAEDTVLNEQLEAIEITNDIDPTTPGFYTVQYKFKNSNGYTNTGTRFVLVTNIDSNLDNSGLYLRNTNNAPMNVEKVATGLYKTDNVGGVPLPSAFAITVYFGQLDDSTLVVPVQPTTAGDMYCVNASIKPTPSDTTISWAVRNASFGTAQRTFVKSNQ